MAEFWGILELMGHRRLAGIISEEQIAGCAFVRLDIPAEGEEKAATQFYAPAAVYCITPTTEELARAFASDHRPAPVQRWELPALPAAKEPGERDPFCDQGTGEEEEIE